ncbi:hypothetical protein [Actinokineospora sp.]
MVDIAALLAASTDEALAASGALAVDFSLSIGESLVVGKTNEA